MQRYTDVADIHKANNSLAIMEKDVEEQMPFRISHSKIMCFDFIFDPLLPSSPPTYIT